MTKREHVGGCHGFTLIELLVVVAVIGIIAGIAVPSLLKARISADEAAAIASLRAINSAQASYVGSGGQGGYAVTLATLGTPCPNNSHAFLGGDLATDPATKSGYRVTLAAGAGSVTAAPDCNGVQTRTGYYSTATPLSNATGRSAYASSGSAVVFYDSNGVPPTEAAMANGSAAVVH